MYEAIFHTYFKNILCCNNTILLLYFFDQQEAQKEIGIFLLVFSHTSLQGIKE